MLWILDSFALIINVFMPLNIFSLLLFIFVLKQVRKTYNDLKKLIVCVLGGVVLKTAHFLKVLSWSQPKISPKLIQLPQTIQDI